MVTGSDTSSHSEQANDSEVGTIQSARGPRLARETQECHYIFPPMPRPSTHVDGDPAPKAKAKAAPTTGAGGRVVQMPMRDRDDVGTWGMYCGNWGGHRKMAAARQHLFQDLISRNPAQVLVAQEVDPLFAQALSDPRAFLDRHWESASDELTRRLANNETWHCVRGTEGDEVEAGGGYVPSHAAEGDFHYTRGHGALQNYVFTPTNSKSCVIAVRSTLASGVNVLQWTKQFDGIYKKNGRINNKYSRLLVAEVHWKQSMAGTNRVVIANVHFHHKTAKQDPDMMNCFSFVKSPYSLDSCI